MTEIVRINLDNELDLILAHKRAMKLAELCGLIPSLQTRFATAVSEIARCSISFGKNSKLTLAIKFLNGGKKEIIAILIDAVDLEECSPESFAYAGRLTRNIEKKKVDALYEIQLALPIQFSGTITATRITSFIAYFKTEAPLSPYDEIRKKNIQLIELSEKLFDSENNYRQLTDALPLIVFSMTNSGNITVINKKAVEILGRKFDSFTLSSVNSIFHEEDYIKISQSWDVAKRKGQQYESQVRLKVKDNYRWHMLQIVPNKDEHGRAGEWIVSMVDIHAQKLVEETLKDNKELRMAQDSLKASNDQLHRKNKELEQFAYVASHDLQEPLRKIRNFISLADRSITPDQREMLYLDKISTAAERMSLLVRDILNYSTLTPSNDYVATDLNLVVEEVVRDLELPIIEQKAIITVDNLPIIDAIATQMNQLFYNLISNALKFTSVTPHITIKYMLLPDGSKVNSDLDENAYHCIAIKDKGIGIDEQYLTKIFSIFQRLHPQSIYQGTGIGLSLCKRIAENHNGTIAVESVPEEGSTFTIYLPQ